MENYKNYLKELFVHQMGLGEELVVNFLENTENDKLINESKNSFKLLYTYPELFYFRESDSGHIRVEVLRAVRDTIGYAKDIKDLSTNGPIEGQIVKSNDQTYIKIVKLNWFQINDTKLVTTINVIKTFLENIQMLIMLSVKLHPEVFTKEKIEVIVKDIDFSKSLKEYFIKNYLVNTIDTVLKIDYDHEIRRSHELIESLERDITSASRRILELLQDKEMYKTDIIRTKGAIKSLEEAKNNVTINEELLEEIYNGIYTHPSVTDPNISVYSKNIIKVMYRTTPMKLNSWNFSPYKYLERHGNNLAKASKELYEAVYNRDEAVEAYYSPYDVVFYIRFKDGEKEIIEETYYPVHSHFRNPHEYAGCTGNFRAHLSDAKKNGNILRFINILSQYLSTTTVGDGAGNDFYFRAKIVMKGDEIKWERDSVEDMQQKRQRFLNQKELQNS